MYILSHNSVIGTGESPVPTLQSKVRVLLIPTYVVHMYIL